MRGDCPIARVQRARIAVVLWVHWICNFLCIAVSVADPHLAIARSLSCRWKPRAIRFGFRLARSARANSVGALRRSRGAVLIGEATCALTVIALQTRATSCAIRFLDVPRIANVANVGRTFQTVDVHVLIVFDGRFAAHTVTNDHVAVTRNLHRNGCAVVRREYRVYPHDAHVFEAFTLRSLGRDDVIQRRRITTQRGAIARVDGARIPVVAIDIDQTRRQRHQLLVRFWLQFGVLLGTTRKSRGKRNAETDEPEAKGAMVHDQKLPETIIPP